MEIIEDLHEIHEELGPFAEFYLRLQGVERKGAVWGACPGWITRHTTLNGNPFSWKDHEFQMQIAGDENRDVSVQKCSQVGMSELSVRQTLAFLGISNGKSGIYTLPTTRFANKFTKTRIDPVIEGSEKLKSMLVKASDSSEMKRFGNSILYINGTSTQGQAISMPAELLVHDEFDFSDPRVLTTYSSRLRHAEDGGYKRRFSTPTVSEYGISDAYERGDKKRYLCKCYHCGHWNCPDFYQDVVIPGFDDDFANWDKDELLNPKVRWEEAYIKCQNGKCKKPIDRALADAMQREWVAHHPERKNSSYSVMPFDLIKYNPTKSILEQIQGYDRRQDYDNFVLGLPFSSKDTQIDQKTMEKLRKIVQAFEGSGICCGIDVGKTLHVVLGKKVGGRYRVMNAFRLSLKDGSLIEQVSTAITQYRMTKVVIDSQPDFSLPEALITKFGAYVHACAYIENNRTKPQYFEVDENRDNMVICQRTKAVDVLVKEINDEKFEFPNCDEMDEVKLHCKGMKRVEQFDKDHEKVARWIKTGPDHYMHALLYFKIACDIQYGTGGTFAVPAAPQIMISGATIPRGAQQQMHDVRAIVKRFGVR